MSASRASATPIELATMARSWRIASFCAASACSTIAFAIGAMFARLAFEPRILDRRVAEDQHRPRHLADLVGARLSGHLDRGVALGEAAHRFGHALQRMRDDAAEQPPDAEDDKRAAERAAAGDLDQQRAQGGKIGGGRDAAREHRDDLAVLQPHAERRGSSRKSPSARRVSGRE